MPRQPLLPSPIQRVRRDSANLLTPWLQRWLVLGALGCILSPALRGYSTLIGWIPFWLLAAPLLLLAIVHRHRLAAAPSVFLVRSRRRRNSFRPVQARRATRAAA